MSNGFFFGVEIKPSTLYTYNVSQKVEFTMATLKNAKNNNQRTVINMEMNDFQYTMCSLITGKLEQQVLNVKIQKGAQIKIWSNGPNLIQLLGTYYTDKDTNDNNNNNNKPLEELSVQTAPIDDNDVIYYPMTKEEHESLLHYNSEEAKAERDEFTGKFGVVMDILESIDDPQPILDNFMAKYKGGKKRSLEEIETILSPKKFKKTDEGEPSKKDDNATSVDKQQTVPKVVVKSKKPTDKPNHQKQNITKTINEQDSSKNSSKKKKQQNANKKKRAKKSPNNIKYKTTNKSKPSKINIPQ